YLNVGSKPAATRSEIEIVVREINLHTAFDQVVDVRPVAVVASASIDLVNHDALCFALAQELDHSSEFRTPSLGSGLSLFKPLGEFRVRARRVSLYRRALFLERDAEALLGRRDTNV